MGLSDPIDTVRVRGGMGLSAPDTEVMAAVGVWLGQLIAAAERVIAYLGQAQMALDQAVHRLLAVAMMVEIPIQPVLGARITGLNTLAPAGSCASSALSGAGTVPNWVDESAAISAWQEARAAAELQRSELQDRARRARLVSDQIGPVTQHFLQLTEQATRARTALQRAAAGYEAAEQRVTTYFAGWRKFAGLWLGKLSLSEYLISGLGPFSDDLIGGLAAVLAPLAWWVQPSLGIIGHDAGAAPTGQPMVTRAAWVLSSLAHRVVPVTSLVVTETVPGHGPLLGCPAPMPTWQGAASGSVTSALTRLGDLHPFDPEAPTSGSYPDCSRKGLPKGTIAIEKITRSTSQNPDGGPSKTDRIETSSLRDLSSTDETSWVVYIPGTQNFAPGEHAFDGVSDLDLMAGRPDQVSEQVLKALDLVGAQKGEPIVLIGHSLGGIAAASIAASPVFKAKYDLGGVITAGSPTATFPAEPGVPYLHLENDEEIVSNLDGKSGDDGPATDSRVIVTRQLSASHDAVDQSAGRSLTGAHPIETHQRTLELALESGSPEVHNVVAELDQLLSGDTSEARFFTGRRVAAP